MLATPLATAKSLYNSIAAWLLIASLCMRFVVWHLELSHLIPKTSFTSALAITMVLILIVRTVGMRRWQWTALDWMALAMLLYCGGVVYLGYLEYGDRTDLKILASPHLT
jgi:hypothetical protein